MDFKYKKATIKDLDFLVETRIEVLRAANQLDFSHDLSTVEEESRNYYINSLEDQTHIAYLVFDCDKWIGAGEVSFYKVMPTVDNPSGKKAYIMNMYTNPAFRRKGVAIKTLDLLVKEAKVKEISCIFLESTEMGRPLYEKYGFRALKNEMQLM